MKLILIVAGAASARLYRPPTAECCPWHEPYIKSNETYYPYANVPDSPRPYLGFKDFETFKAGPNGEIMTAPSDHYSSLGQADRPTQLQNLQSDPIGASIGIV